MLKQLKTKQFWVTLTRDGIILIAILSAYNLYQTRNTPDIAPAIGAQLISGQFVELNQMIKESPVLIYFWGSWCPMCSYTSSTVTALAKKYPVITIALSSGSEEEVLSYLKENKYHFPVINDPDGTISQKWGVVVTPTFFIVNRNGKISSVTTGISSEWGLIFRLWLAS